MRPETSPAERLRARALVALVTLPGIGALTHLMLHTLGPLVGLPCP